MFSLASTVEHPSMKAYERIIQYIRDCLLLLHHVNIMQSRVTLGYIRLTPA